MRRSTEASCRCSWHHCGARVDQRETCGQRVNQKPGDRRKGWGPPTLQDHQQGLRLSQKISARWVQDAVVRLPGLRSPPYLLLLHELSSARRALPTTCRMAATHRGLGLSWCQAKPSTPICSTSINSVSAAAQCPRVRWEAWTGPRPTWPVRVRGPAWVQVICFPSVVWKVITDVIGSSTDTCGWACVSVSYCFFNKFP